MKLLIIFLKTFLTFFTNDIYFVKVLLKKKSGFLIFYNRNIRLFCGLLTCLYRKFNHLHDYLYFCVKYFNYYNFLFQASDEKIAVEMDLIGEADIKVDSEEFFDPNVDQANYDGNMWIIICSCSFYSA